eukprot:1536797-Pyramimonas_sp.AAC.1
MALHFIGMGRNGKGGIQCEDRRGQFRCARSWRDAPNDLGLPIEYPKINRVRSTPLVGEATRVWNLIAPVMATVSAATTALQDSVQQ